MNFTVFLRPLAIEDAAVSYQWRNNPEIWKFTPFSPSDPITLEIETRWLSDLLQRRDQKRFAICLKKTGRYIGNIQLINISGGTGELHLFIGETDCWGKGIGESATSLLLDHAFLKLGLRRVTLAVDPGNLAAITIYNRQGFAVKDDKGKYTIMELKKEAYETRHHAISKERMDSLSGKICEL